MDNQVLKAECIVRGRVQLVMFRDFVVRRARENNIIGRVKNLSDGSVYIVAEGLPENMSSFLELIQKGPALSKVESIDIHYSTPQGEFNDFKIDYGN
ncbi:MAG: acylphosphatase [Patescibacteria group bacterium]